MTAAHKCSMTQFPLTRMAVLTFAQTIRRPPPQVPSKVWVAPSRVLPKLACVPRRVNFVQADLARTVHLECQCCVDTSEFTGEHPTADSADSKLPSPPSSIPAGLKDKKVSFEEVCSLLQPLGPDLIAWFAARKVSAATLQHSKIQQYIFQSDGGEVQAAIAFVYYTTKGTSEIKIRTLDKQWKHYFALKGQGTLYGLHNLQPSDSIIIVEGEVDKLSLEEAGYSNVVSVPDGAPECVRKQRPPPEADKSFAYLWESQEYLQHASCILLASDNDLPGHALAEELARRLGRERCLRVLWRPPLHEGQNAIPCKDANDVLVHYGAAAVQRCIDEAKPLPIEGPFKYYPDKKKRHRKNSSHCAIMPQPNAAPGIQVSSPRCSGTVFNAPF